MIELNEIELAISKNYSHYEKRQMSVKALIGRRNRISNDEGTDPIGKMQKSMIVESILLGIPIGNLYFYETDKYLYTINCKNIVDAIVDFYTGEFELQNPLVADDLDMCKFSELPDKIQRNFSKTKLDVVIYGKISEKKRELIRRTYSDVGGIHKSYKRPQ